MKSFLQNQLRNVIRRHQWRRLSGRLALVWIAAAAAGLALLLAQSQLGWSSSLAFPLLGAAALSAALSVVIRNAQQRPTEREIARQIEAAYPDLRGLLLTAVEQMEADDEGAGGYLRYRVLQQAVEHCQDTECWRLAAPRGRLRLAGLAQVAALGLFVATLWQGRQYWGAPVAGGVGGFSEKGLTVTPGDVTLERGETLVVLARFGGALPGGVELVINDGTGPVRKTTLAKSLADPVFGGSVPDVAGDFTYRIDFSGGRSRDFKATVFEYPRLVKADVELTFPAYTALPPRRIEDTRRASAVEGTQMTWTLQLNKPVASATLIARDREKTEIPLAVSAGQAVATLAGWTPQTGQSYEVKLVDATGRISKPAAPLVVEVLPNRAPELKFVSPRGDVRPSALEEVAFEGTVWDDFGAKAYGLAYTASGRETKFIELGRDAAAKEKRTFTQLVRLEDLGVKPDDLVAWYLWADDIGPDGLTRRTSTDLFFAEVRPFEEIFRESREMQGEPPDGASQSSEETRKLVELQKQIINATWKLSRMPPAAEKKKDIAVVADSQAQALKQAEAEAGKSRSPRALPLWSAVMRNMTEAKAQLDRAANQAEALTPALAAEQAAYQALLKLQSRETNVTRNRNRGQGGGQQGNQDQLDELELDQTENRYETQRQARATQSPERREQNQMLNRLGELARRQQDVNERLRELQTALQAARTEPEKEEVRRQLKRLQDEQRQMLADMDELQQRMERPENQQTMQTQREQLERTREDVKRAAEAAGTGSVAQALAAGTRAQRELQEMRNDLRKSSAGEFADDLREMRTEARELARAQAEAGARIAELDDPKRKKLDDEPERKAAVDRLTEQQKRMTDLVERATQVSQQAEGSEPLLSRRLYDTVRKIAQDDAKAVKDLRQELLEQRMLTRTLNERLQQTAEREGGGKALEATSELLRQGYLPQAGQAVQRATAGVDELRRGVERAVEDVLGDDAEALKLAQSELDKVTEQLGRELAQAEAGAPAATGEGNPQASPGGAPGAATDSTPEANPGAPARPGEGPGSGEQNQRGGRGGALAGGTETPPGQSRGGFRLDEVVGTDLQPGNYGGDRGGPIVGGDFAGWSDRLRDVEELIDTPALRDAVANARERARLMRQDFKRDLKKPDWAVVRLQILKPLIEVRARLGEELARRDPKEALVPIDRDPVPARFSEPVRRYYEELGKDK